jgi:hypothetical protein
LGIVSVFERVRQGRLRLFGHVEKKDVSNRRKTWRKQRITDDTRKMKL